MNTYEQKQELRRDRLLRASASAKQRAEAAYRASGRAVDGIPFGQPILVGHHSEKRHRNAIKRCHAAMDRCLAENELAAELRGRAASVGLGGISGDDPDAVAKLREQLTEETTRHEAALARNSAWRKSGRPAPTDEAKLARYAELAGIDLARARLDAETVAGAYSWEKAGPVAGYSLTNRKANMRRLQQRIEDLEQRAAAPQETVTEQLANGCRVESAPVDNRVRILFPAIPPSGVRKELKANGFRWSPTSGAWQRHLSAGALWHARRIAAACLEMKP